MKVSELKYGAPIRVCIPAYDACGYPSEFDTEFVGYHDGYVVVWAEPYSDEHSILYDGVLPEWCSVYDLQSCEWVGIETSCCTIYEDEEPIERTYSEDTKDTCESIPADNVNYPTHYTQGRRELIDVMSDIFTNEEFKGFLKCNCLKYLARYKHKNGIEDLKKASWYLNKLIEVEEAKDREEI